MRTCRKALRVPVVLACTLAIAFSCFAADQAPPPPNTGKQVMEHLNAMLSWYQKWDTINLNLGRASDQIYVENAREIAQKVVQLEFQSALAQAKLLDLSARPSQDVTAAQNGVNSQGLAKFEQTISQNIAGLKAQLAAVNGKIAAAPARRRGALLTQRDTAQGQLELAQTLDDNLKKLTSFVSAAQSAEGAAGLTGKILALQRSTPGAQTAVAAANHNPLPVNASGNQPQGLIGQFKQMFHLVGSLRTLQQMDSQTRNLQSVTQQLRAPLLAALRTTLQQGKVALQGAGVAQPATSNQPPAANPGDKDTPAQHAAAPAPPGQTMTAEEARRSMTELIGRFKLLSAAAMPLSQEMVLLGQSQANLSQLKSSLSRENSDVLWSVLLRVIVILVALGLIWLFSELWRRAVFRYVHEPRRRRQFLVMRRVVTGFCMGVIILLGFVSEFSSLATYAGLITAGIAVSLQAILLSIAAYFFLMGRYGIRVGDRVTVTSGGTVTGDVIDMGLVRFYLMELAGTGIDLQPTGRMVVYSNSVLFQAAPFYRQIPGTEYSWRELVIPVHPEGDVKLAEKALLEAVKPIYEEYRSLLEKQHQLFERALTIHTEVPSPYTRVRFTASGLEAVVHYPIPLRRAAELDDRVVVAVTEALRKDPSVRLASGGVPMLRAAIKS